MWCKAARPLEPDVRIPFPYLLPATLSPIRASGLKEGPDGETKHVPDVYRGPALLTPRSRSDDERGKNATPVGGTSAIKRGCGEKARGVYPGTEYTDSGRSSEHISSRTPWAQILEHVYKKAMRDLPVAPVRAGRGWREQFCAAGGAGDGGNEPHSLLQKLYCYTTCTYSMTIV